MNESMNKDFEVKKAQTSTFVVKIDSERCCLAWRGLQGDLIAAFQYITGLTRKLGINILDGHVVIGQGVMV